MSESLARGLIVVNLTVAAVGGVLVVTGGPALLHLGALIGGAVGAAGALARLRELQGSFEERY